MIRNLMLIGGHAGVDGEAHGIHLRARATIRDCYIEGFSGDGIHALCSSGAGGEFEGNANNSHADRVFIENCRNGIYLDGADVNAGNFIAINIKNAPGWGIWGSSFLGNSYIGCHVAGCSLGPYKSDNPNARNVYVGCYSEGGQPAPSFVSPAIVIGGLHGSGIEGTGAVFGMADEGLAINTYDESRLGKVRASLATASGTIVEVHNSSPLSGGIQARQKFSVGFEADGVTPCGLASIYSYPNTSDATLAEAKLMFATRTYGGGGAMTDNMVLDGANLAFYPAANLGLSLGYPSLKWKELHIGSAGGIKVDGMKVVGAQGAAVPDASGGTTVDAEARAAINSLLAKCRAHGLIAA